MLNTVNYHFAVDLYFSSNTKIFYEPQNERVDQQLYFELFLHNKNNNCYQVFNCAAGKK